jgi:hypothetical protein
MIGTTGNSFTVWNVITLFLVTGSADLEDI